MDFERSYQISILSKQIFKYNLLNRLLQVNTNFLIRYFNTCSYKLFIVSPFKYQNHIYKKNTVKKYLKFLDPWFITGFTDAEGCFRLYIYTNTASKIGWYVFLDFKFTLHKKDKDLLNKIKNYFGVGEISKHGYNLINYGIRSIKYLQLIINHFEKFSLKTKNLNDYKLFKLAFNLIINKEHLTKEGIIKLFLI